MAGGTAPATSAGPGSGSGSSDDDARHRPDIDGDGRTDLVMGVPRGLAIVTGTDRRIVVPAPAGTDPINTIFGSVVAAGDFDGDGYDDIAAGDGFYAATVGAVWIFAGGPRGTLVGDGALPTTLLQPGRDGLPGTARSGAFFGHALAGGDLGNGVDGLAVGTMFDRVGGHAMAGSVTLVPGGDAGLVPARARLLSQATPGVPGAPEYNDKFGAAVALGDVNGDDRADLVVGSAGEDGDGMVQVLPGGRSGITGAGATSVTAADLKIVAGAGSVAEFGRTLAVGDLTGDGLDDVAAGAPYARVGKSVCGAVAVLRGARSGISAGRSQPVSQSTRGVVGICEDGDAWGYALATGRLNADARADLVVGAPVESVGRLNGGGAYTVLRGSPAGVTGSGSYAVDQNTPGVPGVAEIGDQFGSALALLVLPGNQPPASTRPWVVAAAGGEKIGRGRVGEVTLLRSATNGRPAPGIRALTGLSFTPPVQNLGWSIAAAPTEVLPTD